MLQLDDVVAVLGDLAAVGDEDHGAAGHGAGEVLHETRFRVGVERGAEFAEQQSALAQQRAGNRYSLRLSFAEASALFRNRECRVPGAG